MIQLEDTLAQVRKEYEMLRIEFEQTLAANEQAGIIILAPSCGLLQAPSLKNTMWFPGFVGMNGARVSQRTLNQITVIHFGSQPGCLFFKIGQFCFPLLRRNLAFGNFPSFSEVPDGYCAFYPCAFFLIRVLPNIAVAVSKAP